MTVTGWAALSRHIEQHPIKGSPAEMRAAFDRLAPSAPRYATTFVGTVPCAQFGPSEGRPVIWLHGGGLVFGSAESHGAMVNRVAHLLRRPVLVPEYRLAPESPWPAALDDTLAVLDASDDAVDVVGDSAGGQLALLAAIKRPGQVRRLGLLSPNTDRTGQSGTRVRNTPHDAMNDDDQDRALAEMAFGRDIAQNPDASPLLMHLENLPPVWITAATNEVLLDDTLLLIAALGRAKVPIEAHIYQGLCHLWMLWPDALPESSESLASLAHFLAAPGNTPP